VYGSVRLMAGLGPPVRGAVLGMLMVWILLYQGEHSMIIGGQCTFWAACLPFEIIERGRATYVSVTSRNHVTWQEISVISNISSNDLHQSCQHVISRDRGIKIEDCGWSCKQDGQKSWHCDCSAEETQAFKAQYCQDVEDLTAFGLSAWNLRLCLVCSLTIRRNDVEQSMVERSILISAIRSSILQSSVLLVAGSWRGH